MKGILSVQKEGEVVWDIYLGHPIFSVQVVDITGDGNKEIVAACWDGFVFICDYQRHVVSFQTMEEAICAFTVGETFVRNKKLPYLAFVGLSSNVFVYTDFNLPSLQHKTLISHLKPQFAETELSKGKNFAVLCVEIHFMFRLVKIRKDVICRVLLQISMAKYSSKREARKISCCQRKMKLTMYR